MERDRGKNLSYDDRLRIVTKLEDGLTYRKISQQMNVSMQTIANLVKKNKETGSVKQRSGQGRKAKLSKVAERLIVRRSKINRKATSGEIANEFNQSNNSCHISNRTVQRILLKYNLRGCVANRKPLLSAVNIKKRYAWSKR